jgi:glycosyltransferase involved in cell wall biosynthesis
MNLLHVTPYYAPAWMFGGVVQAVTGLAETQAASGHTVVVLTTDALDRYARIPVREEVLNGVRVLRRRNWSQRARASLNLSTPRGLSAEVRRLLLEHGVDLIHCHEIRTVENLLVAGHARRLGVPLVVSPHGTLPYDTGRRLAKQVWDRTLGRRLPASIDQVIALTAAEAAEAHRLWAQAGTPLRDDQVAVVPNGVQLTGIEQRHSRDAFRRQWNLGDGLVIVFLGRLTERKGLRLLISAFAELAPTEPAAHLLIAGPDWGLLGRLRSEVQTRRLQSRVAFAGPLSGAGKLEALTAADVFVLPAIGEGFSMATLEAMACGLPVVLTEGCNFPEVATAGAGMVVSPAARPLAEALRLLAGDADLRARMGQRGRELVSSSYSLRHVASELDRVYEAVLRRKSQAG